MFSEVVLLHGEAPTSAEKMSQAGDGSLQPQCQVTLILTDLIQNLFYIQSILNFKEK